MKLEKINRDLTNYFFFLNELQLLFKYQFNHRNPWVLTNVYQY